ncbi:MAG: BON domain-containing protein [Armatimonadota bacterium]
MREEINSSMIGPAEASLFRSGEQIREDVLELLTARGLREGIEVSVNEGVVTLEGRVRNRRAIEGAEAAAREVLGVTQVVNRLETGA